MTSGGNIAPAEGDHARRGNVAAAVDWRDAALRHVVLVVASCGTLPLVLWALTANLTAWRALVGTLVGYSVVVASAALPLGNRRVRVVCVVVALLFVGGSNMVTYGVLPVVPLSMIGAAVIAILFAGRRWGDVVILVGASMFVIVAGLLAAGLLAPPLEGVSELGKPLVWLRFATTFAIVSTLVTRSMGFALDRIEAELARTRDALARLELEQAERAAAESARRRAETALAAIEHRDALGRLAGGIAHDFNNTLTVVLTWAEMLKSRVTHGAGAPDARLVEGLDVIAQAAGQAGQFTRHLLAFARQKPTAPRSVSLDGVVEETMRALERVLPDDVKLVTTLGGVPNVLADPAQLAQVLFNLVLNGRDAMPEGGTLSVTTTTTTTTTTNTTDADRVVAALCVRDTGTGMDAELVARIFEPYFSTKGDKGTGLGLASVRDVLTKNGGDVTVASVPGEGSTFTVTLPLAPREGPLEAVRPAALAPARQLTARVVVADDNVAVRTAMANALRDAGAEVFEATSGDELLDVVRARTPVDLVCSDSVMPGMTEEGILASLALLAPQVSILICSGDTEDGAERDPHDPSHVERLVKPVGQHALVRKVREMLSPAHPAAGGGSVPPGSTVL